MANALVRTDRSVGTGYVLLVIGFLGVAGLHRIYAGRTISGLIWLATFGLCGFGQALDIVFLPRMIQDHNEGRPVW